MDKKNIIKNVVEELKKIGEIKAVVLAGSHATGIARPDSDIDFGIYYDKKHPLDIAKIAETAKNLGAFPNAIIVGLGEWGKWMDGGAWLIIDKQSVDFIYRNIEFVEKTIEDSFAGRIETDYYQQPAFGFYSYMYCSETKYNSILHDPTGIVKKLKKKVNLYPQKLKNKIINVFLWDAQFSFSRAEKSAKRLEVYIVAGCLTRIVADLMQVLYAINETYYLSEKKLYRDLLDFKIFPPTPFLDIQKSLSHIGADQSTLAKTLDQFITLIQSFLELTKEIYQPKFKKNLDTVKVR